MEQTHHQLLHVVVNCCSIRYAGRTANCFSIHHETHTAVEAMYKAARDAGGMLRMRPRGRREGEALQHLKGRLLPKGRRSGAREATKKCSSPEGITGLTWFPCVHSR